MRSRAWWIGGIAVPLAVAACAGSEDLQRPIPVSDEARVDAAAKACLARPGVSGTVINANEAHAAVNPTDPNHLVVAWQAGGPEGSLIQTSASFDGGATWSAPTSVPISACAGGPRGRLKWAADPWVTIDAAGLVFVVGIGLEAWGAAYALVTARSADGGRTWGPPSVVASTDGKLSFYDNAAITADPLRERVLYVTTTHYSRHVPDEEATHYGPVGFSRSADGGATWSSIVEIGDRIPDGRISAPQIVADPRNGKLYLIYFRSDKERRLVGVRGSTDGGLNWTQEVAVAPHVEGPAEPREPIADRAMGYADDVVQGAVDAQSGAVYLVYADGRRDPKRTLGVSLAWSVDGVVWSPPVAVSDTTVAAWLPAVAVAPDGEVAVVYVTGDMKKTTTGIAPVQLRLRRFHRVADRLIAKGDEQIDVSNYAWPGDYLALVHTARGFMAAYGRSTDGPAQPLPATSGPVRDNPTDVFVRHAR